MLNEEVEVHKIKPVNTAKKERAGKGRTKPASQDEQNGNRCGYKHEYRKCPAFGYVSHARKIIILQRCARHKATQGKCMLWNRQ